MDNLLNEILKADEQAKKKLDEAQQYRLEQLAMLPQKKAEIEKQAKEKAVGEALERGNGYKNDGEKQLQKLKNRNKAAAQAMDELFKNNASKWVDRIVNDVIGE